MEAFMPIATGLLAALATWVLIGTGVDGCLGQTPRDGGGSAAQAAVSARLAVEVQLLLWRLGKAIPDEVANRPGVRRCVRELAQGAPRAVPKPFRAALRSLQGPVDDAVARGLWVALTAASALAGGIVALSPWGILVGTIVPTAVLAVNASRRDRMDAQRVESAMPEAFSALAISLGSGHTLAQGMRFVGGHAEEPIRSEFLRVACSIECGIPASQALDDLLKRMPAPGLGLVSLALKVSQRTGAPLRDLLADAAAMVLERTELMRRLDVKTSQARMSARLVALMPIAMVGALTLLSPDFRDGLAEPVGVGSVAVALALNVCAWIIIRRIMEVEV